MKGNSCPDVKCSGCGSSSLIAAADGTLICEYCGADTVPLPECVCPACGAACELGARRCGSCGAELAHECPTCGALNPLAAGNCVMCGQQLGVLGAILARLTRRTEDQLREVREEAQSIKRQEEAASRARLAERWADDARDREVLAEARAERERQERILFTVAAAVVALVIVALIAALIMPAGSGPLPPP